MARLVIKIDRDDINTQNLGNSVSVVCNDNIELIFTNDALTELVNDFKVIAKKPEKSKAIASKGKNGKLEVKQKDHIIGKQG